MKSLIFEKLIYRKKRINQRISYFLNICSKSDIDYSIFPCSEFSVFTKKNNHIKKEIELFKRKIEKNVLLKDLYSSIIPFRKSSIEITQKDIKRKYMMKKMCPSIDQDLLNNYKLINWHKDFFSSYKWPKDKFFQDIEIPPNKGVDIKVPWELSRFQFIGELLKISEYSAAEIFILFVVDWITANPFKKGVNWRSAMDVSLRAINWIMALYIFEKEIYNKYDFQRLISNSIRDHGNYIFDNLDYVSKEIPTCNHYLSDLAGLLFISAYFPDFHESDKWLIFSIQQIIIESEKLILDDGMCYEASTGYHKLITEIFLNCACVIEKIPLIRRRKLLNYKIKKDISLPKIYSVKQTPINFENAEQVLSNSFYNKLQKMVYFSLAMKKPNGFIFQLGDNDSSRMLRLMPKFHSESIVHDNLFGLFGNMTGDKNLINSDKFFCEESKILSSGISIKSLKKQIIYNKSFKYFPSAGICILSNVNAWIGVSCGSSGRYNRGGHGHNDKNSFELNVNSLDYIIDGGSPFYTSNFAERNRYRSTKSHSTLLIENEEQNSFSYDLKGLFELKENASPNISLISDNEVVGIHYGYDSRHKRTFKLLKNDLLITDEIKDKRNKYLNFNLHPNVLVDLVSNNPNKLKLKFIHNDGSHIFFEIDEFESYNLFHGAYSCGYLNPIPNLSLRVKINSSLVKYKFSW